MNVKKYINYIGGYRIHKNLKSIKMPKLSFKIIIILYQR